MCKECVSKDCSRRYRKNYIKKHGQLYKKKVRIFKVCTSCKVEFKNNEENFFKKREKRKLASGEEKISFKLTATCKRCHGKDSAARHRKKMCKEMNCSIDDYKENWTSRKNEARMNHPELKHLSSSIRQRIGKMIDNGYVFTTYEQYKKEYRIKMGKSKRKYDYGDVDFLTEEMHNKSGIVNLTDAYVAMTMHQKVSEVPKELIETKRVILKLKREFKKA